MTTPEELIEIDKENEETIDHIVSENMQLTIEDRKKEVEKLLKFPHECKIDATELEKAVACNPKECEHIIFWLETDEFSIRNLQTKIDSEHFDGPTVDLLETIVTLLKSVGVPDEIIKVSPEYILEAKKVARLRTGKYSLQNIEKRIQRGDESLATMIELQKCIEELRELGVSEERIQRNHILNRIKRNNPPVQPKKDSD